MVSSSLAPSKSLTYGSTSVARKDEESTSGFESDGSIEDRLTESSVTWMSAAWVINASVIGMGVLTIPRCFAVLGWICGLLGLVVCLFANIFIGYLMLQVREVYPRAISLADAVYFATGSRRAKTCTRVALYTEKVVATCAYIHLMANTLGSAFYTMHWCEGVWCAVVTVVFLPLIKVRNIHETHGLNILNFACILVVVVLTCGGLAQEGSQEPTAKTALLPTARSFTEFFGAVSMMVFAYAGNWMYFELMAEMQEPRDFMKAFTVAGPTQLGLYGLVGVVCYSVLGDAVPKSIVEAFRFGVLQRLIALFLLLHIMCGTGTNTVVLTRFFHSRISPKEVNSNTARAYCTRLCLYAAMFGGGALITMAVQSFSSLVTLIGAMFEAPISFILPVAIYAAVLGKQGPTTSGQWRKLTLAVGAVIAVFGTLTMIFGVIDAIRGFGLSSGTAFSCNCKEMWNVCECSAHRMPLGTCAAQPFRQEQPHGHAPVT